MDRYEVISKVKKQLALDFNCSERDFDSYKIVITELKENSNRAMQAACFGGSAVFSVKPSMASDFKRILEGKDPDWIFDSNSLIMLTEILYLHGHNLDNIYEYSVADVDMPKTEAKFDFETVRSDFERYSCEPVVKEALEPFDKKSPAIEIIARKDGKIIGAVAAFEKGSDLMEVSLAVAPEEKFGFAPENILAVAKDIIIDLGKIPYFGGASSKISHSTGTNAGFFPFWTQIVSRPRDDEFLSLHGTR